jgi:WD40 repeat protein
VRDDRFVGHAMPNYGVAASRDGEMLASMGRDRTLRIWGRTGKQLHSIQAGGRSLSMSPDGGLVAVSVHREGPIRGPGGVPEPSFPIPAVELWSTRTGKLVRSLDLTGVRVGSPGYGFYSVSFSHDGRLVAGIAKEGLFVWDAATGTQKRKISLPHPAVDENRAWHAPNCGCAFSPTEDIIAVPTAAGSISFFDVESASDKPLAEVKGHDGPVHSVAWRRDGQYLVSGGIDSTIVLWQVNK